MLICKIWLFDWYFPQFCKSDIEVRISRSVSEGPFDFEITRVDCIAPLLKEEIETCLNGKAGDVFLICAVASCHQLANT